MGAKDNLELEEIMVGNTPMVYSPEHGNYVPAVMVLEKAKDVLPLEAIPENVQVVPGAAMRTESIEETQTATMDPAGNLLQMELQRKVRMVEVDQAQEDLRLQKTKLKLQAVQSAQLLLSLGSIALAVLLGAATWAAVRGVWETRHIVGTNISEALGLLFKIAILGVGVYALFWLLGTIRLKRREEMDHYQAAGTGTADQQHTNINITVARDFKGNLSTAQEELARR